MSYEPLHHKYRPQKFAELVGQSAIASTLSNAIQKQKIAPAYLFTGPRGTGKTSSARILAKSLNCLNSNQPTPDPCGKCEVCRAIASGSALDVIEIDAASNTGVDNIREIIERAQFAPVRCRYKVYVIDECLTGDSLIPTSEGLMRINNPSLKGKSVLSYNENKKTWEYKKVLRWLKRGTKETLAIETGNYQIRCTENHLIRTETGWLEARNVKEGMKILSPASVDVGILSTSMARTAEHTDLKWDTSLKETNTEASLITKKLTITSNWEQNRVENGCQICNNNQFPQWTTNLEKVEFVSHAGHEQVYDLEVEDNHNFVANGLLVHNCHMLSTAAFNALLKTLEEPPRNVIFVLATTDPQRVLSTIISRCQRFDYRRIPLEDMIAHLKYIATAEEIDITEDAITLVAQIANGGLRDAESLLDQLSLLPETITVEKVWALVGAVPERDLLSLLEAIRNNDPEQVLQQCRHLLDRGREPIVVLQNLASLYLNLLIAKTAAHRRDLVAVTETGWQKLTQAAKNWEIGLILQGQQQLKQGEGQLKNTTQPRLWLEVILLGLLPAANLVQSSASTQAVIEHQRNSERPTTAKTTSQSTSLPQEASKSALELSQPDNQTTRQGDGESYKSTPEENNLNFINSTPYKTEIEAETSVNTEDSQTIWSEAIKLVQPPTTQALLIQQCHLVKLESSVAVIGISSSSLSKLFQGKVSNIESAFTKVCQRKIKVHFEVASVGAEKKKVNSDQDKLPTVNSSNNFQATANSSPTSEIATVATPVTSVQSPQPEATESAQSDRSNSVASVLEEQQPTDLAMVELRENDSPLPKTSSNHDPNYEQVNSTISPPNNCKSETDFQKAIELFAKHFEGEIVTLSDYETEQQEDLGFSPETATQPKNKQEFNLVQDRTKNIDKKAKQPPESFTIISDRPPLSDYEDEDDIPF
jgi:DNA polymerase-3 subunit gamma/tau